MQNCWTVVVQLPCCTPFSIPNQSIVPYRVITVASWPAHRFFRGQVRWSGVPISFKSFPQFVMIHTVKGFSVVDETSVDVFYGIPLLYDPASVGNLIYGSSAFSKPSLDIWKFLVRIMLKPSMHDFKHDLTSMGDECNCPLAWTFFSASLLGNWDEDWCFPALWLLLGLPDLFTYWVQHFDNIIL